MEALGAWRTAKIYVQGEWEDVPFEALRQGDVFRLFDPGSTEPVKDVNGNDTFIADTDPEALGTTGNSGLKASPYTGNLEDLNAKG